MTSDSAETRPPQRPEVVVNTPPFPGTAHDRPLQTLALVKGPARPGARNERRVAHALCPA